MKRRMFIQALPMLYTPFVFAQPQNSLIDPGHPTATSKKKYFDFQGSATHNTDGSWSFLVRAVLKGGDFSTAIPFTLLIATDASFSQVVYRKKLVATPERSFVVLSEYASPYPATLLYYKYVIDDSATLKLSDNLSSAASEAKPLSPWAG